jgi:hypothetical protein
MTLKHVQSIIQARLKMEERFLDFLIEQLDHNLISEDDYALTKAMAKVEVLKHVLDDIKDLKELNHGI